MTVKLKSDYDNLFQLKKLKLAIWIFIFHTFQHFCSMINNLKNAIQNKKLYFFVSVSNKNIGFLKKLMISQIISSFYLFTKQKKKFLIVFINYGQYYQKPVISNINTIKNISLHLNNNTDQKYVNSNFVLTISKENNKVIKFR